MTLQSSPVERDQQFLDAIWYRTMTLKERMSLLSPLRVTPPGVSPEQLEQATRRLNLWKEQAAFQDSAIFTERLELDGMSEQDLLFLLTEPMEHAKKCLESLTTPAWLNELSQALEEQDESSSDQFSGRKNTQQSASLFDILSPLLAIGRAKLR